MFPFCENSSATHNPLITSFDEAIAKDVDQLTIPEQENVQTKELRCMYVEVREFVF